MSEKGVMLCERPPEVRGAYVAELPFKPSSYTNDPLGIPPSKKVHEHPIDVKPPSMIDRNKERVRALEASKRDACAKQRAADAFASAAAASVTALNTKLRTTILSGASEQLDTFWAPAAHATTLRQGGRPAGQAGHGGGTAAQDEEAEALRLRLDVEDFVDSVVREATGRLAGARGEGDEAAGTAIGSADCAPPPSSSRPASSMSAADVAARPSSSGSSTKGPGKKSKSHKPAWALSEEEAAGNLAAEEAELLGFADSLNFDGFILDLESDPDLKESLQELQALDNAAGPSGPPVDNPAWRKTFVRAMNHAAMKKVGASKSSGGGHNSDDEEGKSFAGQSDVSRGTHASVARSTASAAARAAAASGAGGAERWESSTRAGDDDVARMQRLANKQREAEEFLRENPELRSVHSPASVRTLLHKAEAATGVAAQ